MKGTVLDLVRDEAAQGLTEYVLILSLVATAAIFLLARYGEVLPAYLQQVTEAFGNEAG